MAAKPTDIDGYLSTLPENVRATLEQLRRMIKTLAPDAVESISYGMPTFKYHDRPLVYFGAAKNHCALYGTSQGTVRFPHGEPPDEAFVRALLNERIADIDSSTAGR